MERVGIPHREEALGSSEGSYQGAAVGGLGHRAVVACREEVGEEGFQDRRLQGTEEGRGGHDHRELVIIISIILKSARGENVRAGMPGAGGAPGVPGGGIPNGGGGI